MELTKQQNLPDLLTLVLTAFTEMSFTISNKNGVLLNSPRNNESWLSIVLKGLETQHQP